MRPLGLLLHARVTPADVQDRDGGLMVLSTLFGQFPFLKKLFADTAYAGPVFQDGLALAMPGLVTAIVRRCDRAKAFVVLPKRWILERTAAEFDRQHGASRDTPTRSSYATRCSARTRPARNRCRWQDPPQAAQSSTNQPQPEKIFQISTEVFSPFGERHSVWFDFVRGRDALQRLQCQRRLRTVCQG